MYEISPEMSALIEAHVDPADRRLGVMYVPCAEAAGPMSPELIALLPAAEAELQKLLAQIALGSPQEQPQA